MQKTKVELKATGNNASGKSFYLKKIKDYLETEGINVNYASNDEHSLEIESVGDYSS